MSCVVRKAKAQKDNLCLLQGSTWLTYVLLGFCQWQVTRNTYKTLNMIELKHYFLKKVNDLKF